MSSINLYKNLFHQMQIHHNYVLADSPTPAGSRGTASNVTPLAYGPPLAEERAASTAAAQPQSGGADGAARDDDCGVEGGAHDPYYYVAGDDCSVGDCEGGVARTCWMRKTKEGH